MREVLDQYPDIKIVAEVYSEWTGSIAQKEIASVLPSLDQVDAVLGEGGDGYGRRYGIRSRKSGSGL